MSEPSLRPRPRVRPETARPSSTRSRSTCRPASRRARRRVRQRQDHGRARAARVRAARRADRRRAACGRGRELVGRSERELRELRGSVVSYVPQDPATALNPSIRVGDQIAEIVRAHRPSASSDEPSTLRRVELPADGRSSAAFRTSSPAGSSSASRSPSRSLRAARRRDGRADDRARRGHAGDDPRGGARLQRSSASRSSTSRTTCVVGSVADRIAVMYAGDIVEEGPTPASCAARAIRTPAGCLDVPDPRSRAGCRDPRRGRRAGRGRRRGCRSRRAAAADRRRVRALPPPLEGSATTARALHPLGADARRRRVPRDAVARGGSRAPLLRSRTCAQCTAAAPRPWSPSRRLLHVARGECVALVGESGSGKTTIARCIAGLHAPARARSSSRAMSSRGGRAAAEPSAGASRSSSRIRTSRSTRASAWPRRSS